jgi:hypothetical protein
LVTDDYLGLSAQNLLSLKPAFADVDRNGVPDLVISYRQPHGQSGSGHHQGWATHLGYYANTAAAGQGYTFQVASLKLLHHLSEGDSPLLVDVSGDGLLDLLVGKSSGALDYFRNTGGNNFVLEKQQAGGLSFNFMRRRLSLAAADLDGNGKPDLLTVDDSGELRVYPDFTEKINGEFTATTELLENDLTKQLQSTRLGRGLHVAVAELGGPNKLYLAIGSQGGGLYLLEQTAGHAANPNDKKGLALRVYPNPAGAGDHYQVQVRAAEPVAIVMHDMIGRRVYERGQSFNRSHQLSLGHLKAGVYLLRATSRDGQHETQKLVIQ